jgi:hypothetical protein
MSLSGVAVAIVVLTPDQDSWRAIQKHCIFLTGTEPCAIKFLSLIRETIGETVTKNSKVFDIIVLVGMVVNIILAVFLILYYFDFL